MIEINIILFLVFLVIFFAILLNPKLRTLLFNFFKVVFYAPRDLFFYIVHKDWRLAPIGFIDFYCAEFGGGKTLSAVARCYNYYKKYNDLKVWDKRFNCYATQKIVFLSNVALSFPYTKLISMEQFIHFCETQEQLDKEAGTRTVLYLLGDEFNTQMSSRNFSKNIDSLLLGKLLTCRHHLSAFILTAQRFNQVDALLRQVTRYTYECSKSWRLMQHDIYNAWALENCNNPTIIKPLRRRSFFISDIYYNAYNTYACVDNLITDYKNGSRMSNEQILALQVAAPVPESEKHYKKSFLRKKK